MALTLEQVAALVDDTRRKRRLQQDPYFYGAEERPGALLSDIDKLGLYGDVVGSETYADSPSQVGSFQVQESIPEQVLFGDEYNEPARNVGRTVSGVMPSYVAGRYRWGGSGGVPGDHPAAKGGWYDRTREFEQARLDRIQVPHEMYGGFEPETMAHEIGHRGFGVMGKPMSHTQEHDVIYGQDPRDWARERVLGVYDKGEKAFVPRNLMDEPDVLEMARIAGATGASMPEIREMVAQQQFEEANRMARDYHAALLAESLEPPQSYSERGLIAHDEHSGDEAHTEELRLPQGLLDTVTQPRTKSGSGGDVTPTTLKQAQSMGKAYYYQDGEKKLAVTGDQLAQFKKSDRYDADSKKSALTPVSYTHLTLPTNREV